MDVTRRCSKRLHIGVGISDMHMLHVPLSPGIQVQASRHCCRVFGAGDGVALSKHFLKLAALRMLHYDSFRRDESGLLVRSYSWLQHHHQHNHHHRRHMAFFGWAHNIKCWDFDGVLMQLRSVVKFMASYSLHDAWATLSGGRVSFKSIITITREKPG